MASKQLQCKFCGRIGDEILFDGTKMQCAYCGKTTFISEEYAPSSFINATLNNTRAVLIRAIRYPNTDTQKFLEEIKELATDVLKLDLEDYLANLCRDIIATEQGESAQRVALREKIFEKIRRCDAYARDILGLTLFLRRIKKAWPQYEGVLPELLAAAHRYGIEIPAETSHSEETDLNIDDGIEAAFAKDVPARRMMGNYEIERISVGEGVKKIGDCAFDGCKNVSQVRLGENLAEIGESAFCGLEQLREIFIPASVRKIGACAFRGSGLLRAVFAVTEGWEVISFDGETEKIPADFLYDEERAARLLSGNGRLSSYENCEWIRVDG